jgi:hypothetical protein
MFNLFKEYGEMMAYTRKEKYLRGKTWMYSIKIKSLFFWREYFSSNIKEETDKIFDELRRSPNVTIN